jgi:hypothetical protein
MRRTAMGKKRHKPEEIVAKLRQVDVLLSQGKAVAEAIRTIGVTEVTQPGRLVRLARVGYLNLVRVRVICMR